MVDLTWTAATDRNGISGYYVLRATQSGGPYTLLNPRLVTGTAYRDDGASLRALGLAGMEPAWYGGASGGAYPVYLPLVLR
ncbi:MAG: hypothetical protein ACP5OO_02195 [Chloroflexia bacterium]